MFDRIKTWVFDNERDVVLFVLIFLVSTISFGLGYLVAREVNTTPIVIEQCSEISQLQKENPPPQ